jgi:hypothetical protein
MESSDLWERSVFGPTEDRGLDGVLEPFQRDGVEALPLEDRLRALAAPGACSEVEDLDPRSACPSAWRRRGDTRRERCGGAGAAFPSHSGALRRQLAGSSQALATPRLAGAPARTRTWDARFRKPTLYPLSYGGAGGEASESRGASRNGRAERPTWKCVGGWTRGADPLRRRPFRRKLSHHSGRPPRAFRPRPGRDWPIDEPGVGEAWVA